MRRKTIGMRGKKLSGWRGKNSKLWQKSYEIREKIGMGRKKKRDELEKY